MIEMKKYLIATALLFSPILSAIAQDSPPVQIKPSKKANKEQNKDAQTIDKLIKQINESKGKKQGFTQDNIDVTLWPGGYYLTIGLDKHLKYNPFTGKTDNFFGILYDQNHVTLIGKPANYISMKDANYDCLVDCIIDYQGNITSNPRGKKPIIKQRTKENSELFKKADKLLQKLNKTYKFHEFKELYKKFYTPKPKQEPKWF